VLSRTGRQVASPMAAHSVSIAAAAASLGAT